MKNRHEQSLNGLEFSRSFFQKDLSISETQITNRFLYSNISQNICQGGSLDLKLGAGKKNPCRNCDKNSNKCCGHFGFIRLFLPVLNMGYLKTIQLILSLICKICSRILLNPGEKRAYFQNLIRKIKKKKENIKIQYFSELFQECRSIYVCPYCSSRNGYIKRFGSLNFIHEFKVEKRKNFTPEQCFIESGNFIADKILDPLIIFRILQGISSLDSELLDFDLIDSHPENLILYYIPVPPVGIRPSVFIGEKISNEDDLTVKLSELYFLNRRLRINFLLDPTFFSIKESWNVLQIECGKYFNSEALNLENTNQKFKSLFSRLKGKNGRFRGNLSGKRVDFSGRTIISPDPNLPLNFLGLPVSLAKKLTFPEKVNKINIDRLQRAIIRGNSRFPGANFYTDLRNNKTNIERESRNQDQIQIKNGYKIERHLKNNDLVFFNRQPSLHRISIMAHRIKVIPGKTFKINECVCKPYNADFDGDEMNVHVPQTQKARAECGILLNLTSNINSPANGESMVAATQDFLSSSFLLTSKDQFFSKIQIGKIFQVVQLNQVEKNEFIPIIIKPLELWTGKQVFSLVVFSDLEKWKKKKKYSDSEFGQETIFSQMEKNYSLGKKECSPFLCPFDGWILLRKKNLLAGQIGKFSIGSGNTTSILNLLSHQYTFSLILECLLKISKLTTHWFSFFGFSFGLKDVLPNPRILVEKNFLLKNIFNLCTSFKKQKRIFRIKILSQEKKKESSIQKIFGFFREDFGKKSINFKNFLRNVGIIMTASGSKGSINNLSQMIFFLGQQSVGGERIKIGFIKRILPHFSFKNNSQSFLNNGFINNSFFEGLKPEDFFFHAIAGREGLIDTAIKTAETGYLQRRIIKTLEDITVFYDFSCRTSDGRLIQPKFGEDSINPGKISKLYNSDCFLFKKKQNLIKKQNLTDVFETQTFLRGFSPVNMESFSFIFNSRDFYSFSLKFLYLGKIIDFLVVEYNFNKIFKNCRRINIEPGSSVGAIAAQSIGEPGTQMTLQTFHHAGITGLNITQGVPRINEIMSACKKISSSIICFDFSTFGNKNIFFEFKLRVEKIFLAQLCQKLNIITNSSVIYVDLYFKKKFFQEFNLGFNLDKIVEKIKKIGNIWNKSKYFINKSKYFMRIFPFISKKKYLLTYIETLKIVFFCKKDLSNLIIRGFVDSNDISIFKNKEKTSVFIRNASLFHLNGSLPFFKKDIYSNNILIALETFGIECSRNIIIKEIQKIFSLNDISINIKHISLLAEVMTFQGKILGMNRYGLAKMKNNTLVLASFEKTIENLFTAAVKNKKDKFFGVSENIILGKKVENGTGIVGLCQA